MSRRPFVDSWDILLREVTWSSFNFYKKCRVNYSSSVGELSVSKPAIHPDARVKRSIHIMSPMLLSPILTVRGYIDIRKKGPNAWNSNLL